jgi:hypothetical protein
MYGTASNPRDPRELSGQLPHAPDQKLVPLLIRATWRFFRRSHRCPDQCDREGPELLKSCGPRKNYPRTARNLPSAKTQFNPIAFGPTSVVQFS